MGRKSSLTEKQWSEIERRLIAGEKGRALAREFEIFEAIIRKRFGAPTKKIKDFANQFFVIRYSLRNFRDSAHLGGRYINGHRGKAKQFLHNVDCYRSL